MDDKPVRVYRITHLDNLPQILEQGGIWCGKEMIRRGLPYLSIGDPELTRKRAHKPVTVAAGGTLNDYVPFYFCYRSVMLHKIWRRGEDTYGGGQEPIIHLVTDIETVLRTGTPCFFTDQHAYFAYAEQIDDFARLGHALDWATLKSNIWKNTPDDKKRMERKMAEFLAHRFVSWSCIVGIGVYNERYREDVERMLATAQARPPVKVMTGWYYP